MINKRKINGLYSKWGLLHDVSKVLNFILVFLAVQLFIIIWRAPWDVKEIDLWSISIFLGAPLFIMGKSWVWIKTNRIRREYMKYITKAGKGIEYYKDFFINGLLIGSVGKEFIIIINSSEIYRNYFIDYGQYEIAGGFVLYAILELISNIETDRLRLKGYRRNCINKSIFDMNNDFVYISHLLEEISSESLRRYVAHELYTYAARARFNKRCHYIFSFISLSAPAVAVIFNNLSDLTIYSKMLVSILSAIATIATGIASIVKFRETWIRYRSCCEILKREVTEYISNVGEYGKQGLSEWEKQEIFYKKLKEGIVREECEWKNLRNKE